MAVQQTAFPRFCIKIRSVTLIASSSSSLQAAADFGVNLMSAFSIILTIAYNG